MVGKFDNSLVAVFSGNDWFCIYLLNGQVAHELSGLAVHELSRLAVHELSS